MVYAVSRCPALSVSAASIGAVDATFLRLSSKLTCYLATPYRNAKHPPTDRFAIMVCKCEGGGSCNCGSNCDCSEDCFCSGCAGGQAKRVQATGCNMCSTNTCKCSEGSCGCGDKCKCSKCAAKAT